MQKLLLLPVGAPTLHLAVRPRIVRVGGTTSFLPVRVPNTRFRARRANVRLLLHSLVLLLSSVCPRARPAAAIAVLVVVSAVAGIEKTTWRVRVLHEKRKWNSLVNRPKK